MTNLLDFSTIDTEEKAYILGFIAADGCVQATKKGSFLTIEVALSDRGHLEIIRDLISPGRKLYEYKRISRPNSQSTVKLVVYDKSLYNQLFIHGLHPRKTFTILPPRGLPSHLVHHWIRGYFDGDGTVYLTLNSSRLRCGVTSGSRDLLLFIQKSFNDIGVKRNNIQSEKTYYIIKYSGASAIRFFDYIYQDATIYLERKYNKFLNYIENNRHRVAEWTTVETEDFMVMYPILSREELITRFHRNWRALMSKASCLGLRRTVVERTDYVNWTTEEDDLLVKNFERRSKENLLNLLPNRSWNSIYKRGKEKHGLFRRGCFKNQYTKDEK
jgi:hypothetical protein